MKKERGDLKRGKEFPRVGIRETGHHRDFPRIVSEKPIRAPSGNLGSALRHAKIKGKKFPKVGIHEKHGGKDFPSVISK